MTATREAVSDQAKQFIKGLKRFPILSREEETRLAIQYRDTKDPEVARKLVEGHLRLVVKIARECSSRKALLPDLIQEGCLGLIKAVAKYDPTKGVRLSSYASWWIRAYMFQYIMANARVLRVATTFAQRKLFFSLRRESEKMKGAGGTVDTKELAAKLGVAEADVREMEERLNGRDVQYDTTAAVESRSGDYGELPGDTVLPDQAVEAREFQSAVRRKLKDLRDQLEARERLIFDERLVAENPITLQELGQRCGISRERARQIEERLKMRLRPHFEPMMGIPHAA
jgi:RNA polymerase sigma-32 factor